MREFADFEVRLEWRALKEKYNSGFYLRCAKDAGNNQINLAKGAPIEFRKLELRELKPLKQFAPSFTPPRPAEAGCC